MANFEIYAPVLLQHEGGYVYHPMDQGGPTCKGVTLETFRRYCGESRTTEELKNISYGTWKKIMKDGYWDRCKCDNINSQSVAEIFADWCVNSGAIAIRKVQFLLSLQQDGIVGSKTLKAINESNPEDLFNRIKAARTQFYIDIVKRNPSQKVFMNGWTNRINSFVYKG